MRSRELAELLLRKAAEDEFTLGKLIPDPASPDEVIGFHAQQAIEKMLKAALALGAVRIRRTHSLTGLLDLLRQNNFSLPDEFSKLWRLTPFAAVFRYDELPDELEQTFDRAWASDMVRRVRAWVELLLQGPAGG
jgi:HEPN domain-containing protein